ncbi:MAG: hypothetical protein CO109_12735, partial [Deltaproteobacteria bacterium CG_4_9_14_3_um_filter_65_9]
MRGSHIRSSGRGDRCVGHPERPWASGVRTGSRADQEQAAADRRTHAKVENSRDRACTQERDYRTENYRQPLALLMFDIDKFKDVNDSFGHSAGDVVL